MPVTNNIISYKLRQFFTNRNPIQGGVDGGSPIPNPGKFLVQIPDPN